MVNCFLEKGDPFPAIARYQKKDRIGHTNSMQRLKDVKSCGSDNNLINFSYGYKNFRECMELKGYIRFEPIECGYQNPKYNTGKCNL